MRGQILLASYILVLALALNAGLAPAQAASPGQRGNRASITPFSGSATFTFTASPQVVPAQAARDLLRNRQVETFAVRDATHWRIDIQFVTPVIDSNTETIVANGRYVVAYSTLFNRAYRLPGAVAQSAFLLSDLLGGTGVPPGTTAARYTALMKRLPGHRVRSLGQAQVLGREADVLEVSPFVSSGSGTCSGAKACAQKSKGYGGATIWLDHQYGVVLRYQEHGVPKRIAFERHLLYKVAAISFGRGPSNADLAYMPPVPIENLPANSGAQSSGYSSGGGARFQAPPGFIGIGSPAGMTLSGTGSGDEFLSGGTSYADALFWDGTDQNFVYVKERIRALDLPAGLMTGSAQTAGSCRVWNGTARTPGTVPQDILLPPRNRSKMRWRGSRVRWVQRRHS